MEKDNYSMLKKLIDIKLGKNQSTTQSATTEYLRLMQEQKIYKKKQAASKMLNSSPSRDSLLGGKNRLIITDDILMKDGAKFPSLSAIPGKSSSPQRMQNTLQNIRSMHVSVKRNELDRIERENIKIAKKLCYAEPKLSTNRQMKEQFNELK